MTTNRWTFFAVAAALVAAGGRSIASAGEGSTKPRPNILYIMSDDHAAHAISAYGSRVNQTPNIDRLAKEGIRFDRCYAVNSICTPSRATILTGKYSHINGVPVFNRFDGSQPTVAKYLQAAGYHTGMIGKWHLGSDPTGFDRWTILPGQGVYFDPAFLDAKGRRVIPGYVTDVITDLAIDFLKNRPKDKPFFLMCHHKAPHRPWEPDEKHRAMFAGKQIPEPPTLTDDYATRADAVRECQQKVFTDLTRRDLKLVPPENLDRAQRAKWLAVKPTEVEIEVDGEKRILTGDALDHWKYQRYLQDYLACVQAIDDNVGRLLDWLDKNGLRENTVVIYTSDQGFFLGDHGLYDKRFMYEPSVRMPFLVRWPGVAKAGAVQEAMAINPDFAPTFLAIAGLAVPPDMQGRSLVPLLEGNRPADWRTSWYYRYYHDPGDHNTRAHYGVRTETHKLIYFWKKDQWELFDLVKDPDELHNLYDEPAQGQVVARLKEELYRLKKELKDDDQFADQQPPPGVDGQPQTAVRPKPLSVLFLLSDDQRHDTIHALGNSVIQTPHLDRLAQRGFTFRNAAIMGSMGGAVCLPSRAMLMSGRTLWHVPGDLQGVPLWPEVMGRAGYATYGAGKWHNGPASFARAFGQGGPVFFGGMSDHARLPIFDFDPTGQYPAQKQRIGGKFSSELLADAVIELLRGQKGDRPFFLYVAFTAPHDPRTPPGPYARMYDPQKIPLPKNFLPEHPFDNGELKVRDELLAPWPRSPETIRRQIADYYGMISHLDAQIGRILQTLDQTGRAGDTLVIFASDNGLALGSHGLLGKQSLYEHSQRVPLIMAGPGIPHGQSRALVYLYDLFPTVCELTGLNVPAGVEGKSLVPVLRGRQRQVRDYLIGAYREFQRSIREPRWKLIEYRVQGRRTTQLFDLETDPWELKNLADDPAAQQHRRRLDGLLKESLRAASDPVEFFEKSRNP